VAAGSAVRLGLVGCGAVAQRGYLPAFSRIPQIELAAVAEPDPARRASAAGASRYADLDSMLAAERLDGVIVCSPPELHLAHAGACAAAGLPTLVEKPPGLDRADAEALAALRPTPAIGFNRRFAHGLATRSGSPREPSRITAVFDAPSGDWDPRRPPVEPLLDLGCHLVDLCLWITGAGAGRARALPAERGRARFELELAHGARLYAECGAAAAYREHLELRDADGRVAWWCWPESGPQQVRARLRGRVPGLLGSWQAQLEAFAAAVSGGGRSRLAGAGEAVAVMAAIDAVQASADAGGDWVTVPGSDHPAADARAG
jgi:predicted dehydrogenase